MLNVESNGKRQTPMTERRRASRSAVSPFFRHCRLPFDSAFGI
jgi:hypothetical protein